jgi:hypothetical protein
LVNRESVVESLSVNRERSTKDTAMRRIDARWIGISMATAVALLIAALLPVKTCMAQAGSSAATATSESKSTNAQDSKGSDPDTTRLKIIVTNSDGKPVGNASVYLRFNEAGGFLHKDKLAEMSFKTNDDGTVKVPNVPVGKVLIQVVGKGIHTFGKWYDIAKDQDAIEIKLEKVTRWY